MGFCDAIETIEIGSDRCTVFRQGKIKFHYGRDWLTFQSLENEKTKTATIVVRGGTLNLLEDIERAIDDGVNVIKNTCKDTRMLPGAGAIEIELARRLRTIGEVRKYVLKLTKLA